MDRDSRKIGASLEFVYSPTQISATGNPSAIHIPSPVAMDDVTEPTFAVISQRVEKKGGICGQNAFTRRDRKAQLALILAMITIPILAVVIQNILVLAQSIKVKHEAVEVHVMVNTSVQVGGLIHGLQIERGATSLYVSSRGARTVQKILFAVYRQTDALMDKVKLWPTSLQESKLSDFKSSEAFRLYMNRHRYHLDPKLASAFDEVNFYTDTINVLLRAVTTMMQQARGTNDWKKLVAFGLFVYGKEQVGNERARGAPFFAGGYTNEELIFYAEKRFQGESYLRSANEYSPIIEKMLDEQYINTTLKNTVDTLRAEILQNTRKDRSTQTGTHWFENMTRYINILHNIERALAVD
ncbi:PREDICTED: uncharacterized protein LOC106808157, partial [Priapulus caudatus]|uniref:Uncharacterized protein LOC106808157 n=1 Tax=Priapulus caudatus TaxID=37621 RepID=A0ABM1E204_PRICU